MNYGEIKKVDIANGEGVRVSLFVSGCTHHCKNCFNEATWNFNFGEAYTQETEKYILDLLNHDYIAGLSVLGGEPFEFRKQRICTHRKIYGCIVVMFLKNCTQVEK